MNYSPELVYTITTQKAGPGKKPLVRLSGEGWPLEFGIEHMQFTSQRAAAYFSQHHAAGRRASLRLMTDGYFCGERPIPPIEAIPIPAAHESEVADFFQFFLTWPTALKEERRKFSAESRRRISPEIHVDNA